MLCAICQIAIRPRLATARSYVIPHGLPPSERHSRAFLRRTKPLAMSKHRDVQKTDQVTFNRGMNCYRSQSYARV